MQRPPAYEAFTSSENAFILSILHRLLIHISGYIVKLSVFSLFPTFASYMNTTLCNMCLIKVPDGRGASPAPPSEAQ